ncbi:zinc-binding metallopeptidase, partial [Hoylesella shahii]
TDKSYNFVPADSAKAAKLAIITKFMWFDPYAQIVGLDFIKENAPRIIITVGIPGYTRHNSEVLGSAEGGYKVTLTKVNALTADVLKDYSSMTTFYFHTMHHEFMHILNQKKPYDESYDNISRADYLSGNWTSWSDRQAQKQGFVSAYSMENPAEDFAEMYAKYVTRTPQEWNDILTVAGTKGKSIINRKLKMVRDYMKTAWDADIDLLRNDILRRGGKIETLNLESFE